MKVKLTDGMYIYIYEYIYMNIYIYIICNICIYIHIINQNFKFQTASVQVGAMA